MNENVNNRLQDHGDLDDLMRNSLRDHRVEPSPAVWKGINRRLIFREVLRFNFTNVTPKSWIAGAVGVAFISAAVFFGIKGFQESPSDSSSGNVTTVEAMGLAKAATPAVSISQGVKADPSSTAVSATPGQAVLNQAAPVQRSRNAAHNTDVKIPVQEMHSVQIPPYKTLASSANEPNKNSEKAKGDDQFTGHQANYVENVEMIGHLDCLTPVGATMFSFVIAPDSLVPVQTSQGTILVRKAGFASNPFYTLSLGIQPDATYNSGSMSNAAFSYWINAGFSLNLSRFSITTGLGIGNFYDENAYRIEYISNDVIGSYSSVVSYTVGANNEIHYTTVTENVYDSIQHVTDDMTRNRNSYLQIPLLFGYRIFQTNHVSLALRAGPAVSFLTSTKEGSQNPIPDARIIKVEDQTPPRSAVNWQIWTDINLEIRMNHEFSFFVAPSFKYYLNPMIRQENSGVPAPWSVGLGVGLQYNFGRLKY